MLSEPDRDMGKPGGDHNVRRTAAIASLKVGWCLFTRRRGGGAHWCGIGTTRRRHPHLIASLQRAFPSSSALSLNYILAEVCPGAR